MLRLDQSSGAWDMERSVSDISEVYLKIVSRYFVKIGQWIQLIIMGQRMGIRRVCVWPCDR